jgi:secreted trypsin-like serine protease
VAPDRVLTAGDCVMHRSLSTTSGLSAVVVGGVVRDATGFAMHPAWRHANGPRNVLDDVAMVRLAEPVTDIAPVTLGATPASEARIVGSGRSTVPGSGAGESLTFGGGLRSAVLRPITDRACARAFRHHPGNAGERFDAARMLCATDVDGLAPLSSGCNGDIGGPLYAGTPAGAGAARRGELGRRPLRSRPPSVRVRAGQPLPHLHRRRAVRDLGDHPPPAAEHAKRTVRLPQRR